MTRSDSGRTGHNKHRKPGGGRRRVRLAVAIGAAAAACTGIVLGVLSATGPANSSQGQAGNAVRTGSARQTPTPTPAAQPTATAGTKRAGHVRPAARTPSALP